MNIFYNYLLFAALPTCIGEVGEGRIEIPRDVFQFRQQQKRVQGHGHLEKEAFVGENGDVYSW